MAEKIEAKSIEKRGAIPRSRTTGALTLSRFLEPYGMLIVLILLVILAAVLSPTFLTTRNLLNVARQVAINGLVTIGMTMTILTGGIDLSVGGTLALSSVLVAGFKNLGVAAIAIALIAGALVGALNGVIVGFLRLHPFIVTLGTLTAVRGLALIYSQGHPIEGTPPIVQAIASQSIGEIPIQAILLIVVVVLSSLLLWATQFGTHVYAIGSNEEAARLSGVRVRLVKVLVYSISGMLAATAGVVVAGFLNVGDPQFGVGAELDAIAASVIGGVYLMGGRGSIPGAFLGILIIGVIRNMLNLLNIPGDVQWIINGVLIVIAITVQRFRD